MKFTENLENAMERLHTHGAFLTTKSGKVNSMTISWGHIGFAWGKPIFTVMVRQSRHTKTLLDASGEFTVSIPTNDNLKEQLAFCGKHSGRDMDKLSSCGLSVHPAEKLDTPVISGGGYTYECKVVGKSEMNLSDFDGGISASQYASGDTHTFYYGEIVDCYISK